VSEHGDPSTIAAITAHMTRCFGEPGPAWHEVVMIPAGDRDSIVLFTTGMSDLAMAVDPRAEGAPIYAELMLRLPATWQLGTDLFEDERWSWPVRWLKTLARMPHECATWLGYGHTIPNGDPARPLAPGVPFTGFIVAPPTSLSEEDSVIRTPTRAVALYAIYPLHPDELAYKLQHGAHALFELLDAAGVTDEIVLDRPSVVPLRRP
jgi:hypothetical protein